MAGLTAGEVLLRLKSAPSGAPPLMGAEIGDLNLRRYVFQERPDFCGAVFTGSVTFEEAEFTQGAGFKGAVFERGATFLGAAFGAQADFSWCRFFDQAYFWRVQFLGPATFAQVTVRPSAEPNSGYLDPGHANFSWAYFRESADFYRAQFGGSTYFWRTVFCDRVDFAETRFDSTVVFEGTETTVRVAHRDFRNPDLFDRLLAKGIMRPDPEVDTGPGGPKYFAGFDGIESREALRGSLESGGFAREEVNEIEAVWQRHARRMFAGPEPISFRGASFGAPDKAKLIRVNLDRCLLVDSDVTKAELTDVRWDERPTIPILGQRQAIYDERIARTPRELNAVRKLYFDLRKKYESKEEYDIAGDFYYGEMEMRRLAQPGIRKRVSFIAMYRCLGGYGEQPVLPWLWLVLILFAVFPVAYVLTGTAGHSFARGVLHSLEVSTFLKGDEKVTPAFAARLVEGLQRLVLPIPLGMFVVAIKRRFDRK